MNSFIAVPPDVRKVLMRVLQLFILKRMKMTWG